ncbi:hypothetical protein Hrd1104_02250 [Halorhabdus sp. CBA1104]|uniref:hypothetical protein n=1 Tax=unclassified Halorhabdus TaxID=2621901 RepID=UPI0012B2AB25|nr:MULTISPECIES: hypothetical protein [unclassified Halorhabdus]QGN06227.1 hypothetical protein Hrd1104_02250 [Halorhabdus sp. CBA1104]
MDQGVFQPAGSKRYGRLAFVAVALAGIVGFGLADYALTSAGYSTAGMVVWGGGYLGTIVLLWYGWLRPLDLDGN